MPFKTRRSEVAAAIESVEGTAETLVAADATVLPYDPGYAREITKHVRQPARSSLGQLKKLAGRQVASLNVAAEIKGSGSKTTPPAWDVWLQLCGFARADVTTIAIGAVTGGPYTPGELFTDGGTKVGRVVGDVKTGDALMFYVHVSGAAFAASDVLTGQSSAAFATASAGPTSSQGYEWIPISTGIPSGTLAMYRDGRRKGMVGARGNFVMTATLGEAIRFGFAMQGVYDPVIDAALLGPTFETTRPYVFQGMDVTAQGFAAKLGQLTFDMGNDLQPRAYVAADVPYGVKSYRINGRAPTGSMDPEAELVATEDFWGKASDDDATGSLHFEVGSGTGQVIKIACPRIEYDDVSEGERGGDEVDNVAFSSIDETVNNADTDFQIAMV
jgi:hypothetical protein